MPAATAIRRRDFQRLTTVHLRAARTLLDAGHWQAAYYVAGYAVECSLKACIAKQIRRHDFPPREAAKLYTHDLRELVRLADLETARVTQAHASATFNVQWAIVKDWKSNSRYDL